MSSFLNVLFFALIPMTATVGGGIIAAFRPPGLKLGSYLQHFAAGTVFAAVANELLPDVMSERDPVATILGFALGVVLLLVIRSFTEGTHDAEIGSENEKVIMTGPKTGFPIGLFATVGVDVTIDGLLIGIGFAAGAKQGVLLTIALTLELLSLGLATSAAFSRAGTSRRINLISIVGLGLMLLIGASLGATLLSGLSGALKEAVLAFGVAALLFLVTEELLVEAHEVPETPTITATFFVGFLLLLVIGMLV